MIQRSVAVESGAFVRSGAEMFRGRRAVRDVGVALVAEETGTVGGADILRIGRG